MGKVRAKTLGDTDAEAKERDEAEARRQAKIANAKAEGQAKKESRSKNQEVSKESPVILSENEGSQSTNNEETSIEDGSSAEAPKAEKKTVKKEFASKNTRSDNYKKAASLIDKNKTYSLSQGLELLEKTHLASFDETVELHINTMASVNGSMQLPHGTGKSTRVAILAPSKDPAAADALLKEIEAGKINFDVLVATPDAMPRLAKVARVLGPRGLMPNPKNGTVTPNPDAVAKQYAGGHVTFKTEAKAPVLHLSVGKLSFGKDKLEENIKAAFKAVEAKNMRKVTLKSTMSPAILLSI